MSDEDMSEEFYGAFFGALIAAQDTIIDQKEEQRKDLEKRGDVFLPYLFERAQDVPIGVWETIIRHIIQGFSYQAELALALCHCLFHRTSYAPDLKSGSFASIAVSIINETIWRRDETIMVDKESYEPMWIEALKGTGMYCCRCFKPVPQSVRKYSVLEKTYCLNYLIEKNMLVNMTKEEIVERYNVRCSTIDNSPLERIGCSLQGCGTVDNVILERNGYSYPTFWTLQVKEFMNERARRKREAIKKGLETRKKNEPLRLAKRLREEKELERELEEEENELKKRGRRYPERVPREGPAKGRRFVHGTV